MEVSTVQNERASLIEQILDLADLAGRGIYGRFTCQGCGHPGSFSGWAGAMAAHRQGVFVATSHGHRGPHPALRWCSLCAAKLTAADSKGARTPLCAQCARRAGAESVSRVGRRRWLEHHLDDVAAATRFRDSIAKAAGRRAVEALRELEIDRQADRWAEAWVTNRR
ncbi:MAG: hypothetical protein M3P44_00795 [Actinomycetota bacterium]|nr:hypothetical protein [Actinomycetota bacterium]